MQIRIVKIPQWQNKETKQRVSFFGSVPFYTYQEKLQWELIEKECKEVVDENGRVTYFECSYHKINQ